MLPEQLEKHVLGYLTAQRLLTRIPAPKSLNYIHQSNRKMGRAVVYYPAVGLFLGLITFTYLLSSANPWLLEILLTTISIILTGASHLKALSQSMDAWVEGKKDRDTIFTMMRNTHASITGVVTIILVADSTR